MNLFDDAAGRAKAYLDSLATRRVGPAPEAIANLARWNEPLPDDPTDPHEMLRLLDEIGSPATMAMAGPRFFGFVIGSALPAAVAANWLAPALDQHSGLDEATPGASRLGQVSFGSLLDVRQ